MATIDPEVKISENFYHHEFDDAQHQPPTLTYSDTDIGIVVIDGVLSQNECNTLIAAIDIGNNRKNVINCRALSDTIMRRCSEFMPKTVYKPHTSCRINNHDNNCMYWTAQEINPCWRYTNRQPGGQLSWHYDGVYVKSVDSASIYTVLIYLADSDGDIEFKVPNVKFAPKAGRMIAFDQRLMHCGKPNHITTKHYIRSELMFDRYTPIETETDKLAMTMYNAAKCEQNAAKCEQLEMSAFALSPLLEEMILN